MQPMYRLKNVLTGEIYPLSQPSSVIGRNHHCEIKIDSVALSRNHASLHLTEQGVVIEDLNSTNGTYVNNVRIEAATLLRDGDVVSIGNHRLILVEPAAKKATSPEVNNLLEELAQFDLDDRTANKTMIHSTFARSMGLIEDLLQRGDTNTDENLDELIKRALRSKNFDPARVPAVLIVKNSRSRGMLIQLKLPHGAVSDWALGRSQLADVVLDDPTVSTIHAVISAKDGRWFIADNESTNGIKINQQDVSQGECRHGDILSIGSIELIFYLLHQ